MPVRTTDVMPSAARGDGDGTTPPVGAAGELTPSEVALVQHGRQLLDMGMLREALATFEIVATRPAAEPLVRSLINQVHRRLVPRWHFAMLNDTARNVAFRSALSAVGLSGKVVLDIGAGSGLLAMMAADLGAKAVYSCEAIHEIAAVAEWIVAANHFSDRVTVIPRRSFDLLIGRDLERRADVLVTETIDCGLLGEGLLPIVAHARSHLLRPGARIVPGAATLHVALLESEDVHANNYAVVADAFDVSLFNQFSTQDYFPVRLDTWRHRFLSGSAELFAFDFHDDAPWPTLADVELTATATGSVHGVCMWFTAELVPGVVLTNEPDAPRRHWMQAVQCFEQPVAVRAGERVRLHASHDLTTVRVHLA